MPDSRRSSRLNTVVVTPEDNSPTKPENPQRQLCASSRMDGALRRKRSVFDFLKKWRLQMQMLSTGETAVAKAAPGRPSPIGNMKI